MKLHTHLFLVVCGIALFSCGGQQEAPQSAAPATATAPTTAPLVEEKPQTKEERIQEIKLWYSEIQKIGMQNCETKKRVKYEGFDPESEQMPFDQIVKTCKLDATYELVRGDFSGYEWGYQLTIYKKEGKIFFVLVTGGGEGSSFEKRFYCDRNENLIELLENEAEGGEEVKGPGKPAQLNPAKPKIQENIAEYLSDVNFVLTGK
jgi:hypothetical protein